MAKKTKKAKPGSRRRTVSRKPSAVPETALTPATKRRRKRRAPAPPRPASAASSPAGAAPVHAPRAPVSPPASARPLPTLPPAPLRSLPAEALRQPPEALRGDKTVEKVVEKVRRTEAGGPVAKKVRDYLQENFGKQGEIIKLAKTEDGWEVRVEVVEENTLINRLGIPLKSPAQDRHIYEVKLDDHLAVLSYERLPDRPTAAFEG